MSAGSRTRSTPDNVAKSKATTSGQRNGHAQHRTSLNFDKSAILADYRIGWESRYVSLLGRKLALNGRAKFGIFGDGKELAQIAMTRAMRPGDIHAGYYRDQTVNFVAGTMSYSDFFAQLYADPDTSQEICGAGRQMNGFSATRFLDENGLWRDLLTTIHSSADTSPTSSQMARAVGLALASKLYRSNPELAKLDGFSRNGNEIVAATIGDASCAEGLFWEALNAVGVLKAPMGMSIWDDGYGISVPRELQTTKGSISKLLEGFRVNERGEGYDIYVLKAWDYPSLIETYSKAFDKIRLTHIPAIFHIEECTQQLGHSTSGSHERYKSKERLQWEIDFCCLRKMRAWLLREKLASVAELDKIEQSAEAHIKEVAEAAWQHLRKPIEEERSTVVALCRSIAAESSAGATVSMLAVNLESAQTPLQRDLLKAARRTLRATRSENSAAKTQLSNWLDQSLKRGHQRYHTYLHSASPESALEVPEVKPIYLPESRIVNGNQIIQAGMDAILARDPRVCIFGEDVGIGDVNHGLVGLPEKYGPLRIFDTGIREATIIGQGIGLAMRGLRPIAEIQYLDYLIFGLQPLTDDLATLHYRNRGGQKAPLIIRTRGHRLEGIWHTGSPMQMILGSMRGVWVLVPRNMTQAIGFYNSLLRSDDPALIIECLNGYGLKETLPENIGEFTVPLGIPEVIRSGEDVTLVTYGSCCRVALEAAEELSTFGISVEIIDVQSLLPFDREHRIAESLGRTSRLVILDEDVPGGASAFMLQHILETQGGYRLLDSAPITITASEHRSPYGSDGDYFSKPNSDDIVDAVCKQIAE